MGKIHSVEKLTDCKFVNLYALKATSIHDTPVSYYVASRAKTMEELKAVTHENNADGVIIFSVYGEKRDKVVLIRQYRYPIDGYIYEFPAGLCEDGEDFKEAGIRELKEETGLDLQAIDVPDMYSKPFFTTIGMTDESCGTVYGYASGKPSLDGQEDSEEIQIVIADKEEVRRILKEENVAIMCAYQLMHFLESEEGNPFYFLGEKKN